VRIGWHYLAKIAAAWAANPRAQRQDLFLWLVFHCATFILAATAASRSQPMTGAWIAG